jgi:hypothetical protein
MKSRLSAKIVDRSRALIGADVNPPMEPSMVKLAEAAEPKVGGGCRGDFFRQRLGIGTRR